MSAIKFLDFIPFRRLKKSELVQPKTILAPPQLFFKELLSQNSIYQFYLKRLDEFYREKPSIEVILRDAVQKDLLIKNYSGIGLVFRDLQTKDTLVLDTEGNIYACNNVTFKENRIEY